MPVWKITNLFKVLPLLPLNTAVYRCLPLLPLLPLNTAVYRCLPLSVLPGGVPTTPELSGTLKVLRHRKPL